MTLTENNITEYVVTVMDPLQLADFNAWSKTDYSSVEELIENESKERLLKFYS